MAASESDVATYSDCLTNGGVPWGPVDLLEYTDNARRFLLGITRLADLIKQSKHVVFHTGAGISTSCGIRDFRGPNGIWTMKRTQMRTSKGTEPSAKSESQVDATQLSEAKSPALSKGRNEKKRKRGDIMDMLKDRRMKMQPVADAPAELPESSEKHKAESNTDDVVISLDYSASDSPSIKKESNEPAESPIEPGELKEESGTITQKVDTDSSAMSRFSAFKDVPFHDAVPSPTHMVIYELIRRKKAKFLITQNVDGLHLKSGIDSSKLAELHGNVFKEECDDCGKVYCREKPVGTVGLKDTGRTCIEDGCKGKLQDMTLDWGSALPEDDFDDAVEHSKKADLHIILGCSLHVSPANLLPQLTKQRGGKVVIVSLSETLLDGTADLKIRGKCDDVMKAVMLKLKYKFPSYEEMKRKKLPPVRTSLRTSRAQSAKRAKTEDSPKSKPASQLTDSMDADVKTGKSMAALKRESNNSEHNVDNVYIEVEDTASSRSPSPLAVSVPSR